MTSIVTYLKELTDWTKTRLILYPPDIDVETSVNEWAMGRGDMDHLGDLDTIEANLKMTMFKWTRHFASSTRHGRQATFYAWYDEMSGMLHVCLTSREASQLPFGCQVRLIDSPRPILEGLLADPQPGTIALDELSHIDISALSEADIDELDRQDAERRRNYELDVWAITHRW